MSKINERDLSWSEYDHGEARFRRKQLAGAAGSEQLGCSLYELPPGKRAWPYHYHTANEEALFVLSGTGQLRLDGQRRELEAGDFVAFPADERGAHRVINDAESGLRYLVISTMIEPDVLCYPDRETVGVMVGSAPGDRESRKLYANFPLDSEVPYWDEA